MNLFHDPFETRRPRSSLRYAATGGKLDGRRQRFVAITITAANVIPETGAKIGRGVAGETITRGMPIYLNPADSKLYKCDANASAASAAAVGLAAQDVAANQPLDYYRPGSRINYGAVFTKGLIYVVGATAAGDIEPSASLTSGWYCTILGVAETTSILNTSPHFVSSVALA